MTQFRNLLVHRYWKVDNHLVYQNSKSGLRDIESYLSEIEDYLRRKSLIDEKTQ